MICLGLTGEEKADVVRQYCRDNGITRVFIISPAQFRFDVELDAPMEHIEFKDVIMYRVFYRLLQEIDARTLVVVSECMRKRNRSDLAYNCVRNFLNQTGHQIIFQYLPIVESFEDFMILFDFDTRSRWKREAWRPEFAGETRIEVRPVRIAFHAREIPTDARTKELYTRKKRQLIDGIGLRDPHTIPRNLHLFSGSIKINSLDPERSYVARNKRFRRGNILKYGTGPYPAPCDVFEFCHDFADFADFLYSSGQERVDALVTDLKVDQWYLARYRDWAKRVTDAYAVLR